MRKILETRFVKFVDGKPKVIVKRMEIDLEDNPSIQGHGKGYRIVFIEDQPATIGPGARRRAEIVSENPNEDE